MMPNFLSFLTTSSQFKLTDFFCYLKIKRRKPETPKERRKREFRIMLPAQFLEEFLWQKLEKLFEWIKLLLIHITSIFTIN